jgi:hypothetical protein
MSGLSATRAAVLCCMVAAVDAVAAEDAPPSPSPLPSWLIFSGAEATGRVANGWIGADYAPDGIDRSGLRVRAAGSAGGYLTSHPDDSAADITVRKETATLAAGYGWITPSRRTALFIGGEVDAREPDHPAVPSSDRGTHWGVAIAGELWAAPSPLVQVMASASYGSARASWALRAAACGRIAGICLGPETAAVGDAAGSEFRFGLAVSGLSVGPFETRLAAGVAHDVEGDADTSAYGLASVWRRF